MICVTETWRYWTNCVLSYLKDLEKNDKVCHRWTLIRCVMCCSSVRLCQFETTHWTPLNDKEFTTIPRGLCLEIGLRLLNKAMMKLKKPLFDIFITATTFVTLFLSGPGVLLPQSVESVAHFSWTNIQTSITRG